MENHSASEVLGNTANAPFINQLAQSANVAGLTAQAPSVRSLVAARGQALPDAADAVVAASVRCSARHTRQAFGGDLALRRSACGR